MLKRRSWRASTNKSTLAAPGVKGTTPPVSAPSPPDPGASKHSTAAGVTPNLNSRLWLSPDQMSGSGENLAGREKEMNDCRREMDGAMKRGQAPIDPGGRDVSVLTGKRGEEGCIKPCVCNTDSFGLFSVICMY